MLIFAVALFIWFALSIPATLVIGRILGGAVDDGRVASVPPQVISRRELVSR